MEVEEESLTLPPGDDGNAVTYEELAEVEKKFEDVDIWLMRQNYILTEPIYVNRAQLIQRIPHFWAIVIEQAPPEIDHRIQPCDTGALGTLESIEVTRFEISEGRPQSGDPRSAKITFTFGENKWFTNRTLEKTFWFRQAQDEWRGLVSEPVKIDWKEGKDLTEGLLDDAIGIFELEQGAARAQRQRKNNSTPKEQDGPDIPKEDSDLHEQRIQKLIKRLEETPQDALSFFAWFGYRGRNVSAEESAEALAKEKKKRKRWNNGDHIGSSNDSDVDGHVETEKVQPDHEIFPAGEDLAIAISDDLFPGAIRYYVQSLKEDGSDVEAELESDHGDSKESPGSDEPATKKQKIAA